MKLKYAFFIFLSVFSFSHYTLADNVADKRYTKAIFNDKDVDTFIKSDNKVFLPYYIKTKEKKEYHISYVDYDIEMFSKMAILLDNKNKVKKICNYNYDCIDSLFVDYVSEKYNISAPDVRMLILNMEFFSNSAGKEFNHIIKGYNKNKNSIYYIRDSYYRFKMFHGIVSSSALSYILYDIPIKTSINVLVDLGYFRTIEIDGFKITGSKNKKILNEVSLSYANIAKERFKGYIDKKTKKGFSAIESASIIRFNNINSLNKVLEKIRNNDKDYYTKTFTNNIKAIHNDFISFLAEKNTNMITSNTQQTKEGLYNEK